jgi:hypothetical protein
VVYSNPAIYDSTPLQLIQRSNTEQPTNRDEEIINTENGIIIIIIITRQRSPTICLNDLRNLLYVRHGGPPRSVEPQKKVLHYFSKIPVNNVLIFNIKVTIPYFCNYELSLSLID